MVDIAARAREKKLLPDDVQGGTFTITNPGGYGTFHGTPVISQPQAAILGTYAVVKRPWVVQDEYGQDVIAIRPIMNVTLTYDHRLIDGALAGRFPATCARSSRAGTKGPARSMSQYGRADGGVRGRGCGDRLADRGVRLPRERRRAVHRGRSGDARASSTSATGRSSTSRNPTPAYMRAGRHRKSCEDAARWLDNPWVVDGVFVEVADVDAHHDGGRGRSHDPPRARGPRRRRPPLLGRGPGGAPLDVRPARRDGLVSAVEGSCLCGGVTFEVTEPSVKTTYCHCASCKKLSGGAGTVNGRASSEWIRILDGRELLVTYQPDEGSAKTFCSRCGSNLFGGGWPESEQASVRLAAIDTPFDRSRRHTSSCARSTAWETLPDDGAPRYDERAPA